MKLKLHTLITYLFILISFTAKSQTIVAGYNDNDVQKLQTFFAQTDGTTTNGKKMNVSYDSLNPTTWTGITWGNSNPKRVTAISFPSKFLAGDLNTSNFDSLVNLDCSNNLLTSLKVDSLMNLQSLKCFKNQLTSLTVQNLPNLQLLACYSNQLTSLIVQNLPNLQNLQCHKNQLIGFNIQTLQELNVLICDNNQLTSLNLQTLIKLKNISCSNNQLTSLDVQNLINLEVLYCPNNQLTSLDIQNLAKLQTISCSNNQITSLNLQNLQSLSNISCSNNQLTSLQIQNLTNLRILYCDNNQLKFSDMQGPFTTRSLAPQRPFIPIGLDTANNSMSAICGDTINLSAEAYVGTVGNKALTTFNVWGKAFNGTISEITDSCTIDSGKIVLPSICSGNDSVFITMYNPSYPDFTIQTTPVIPTDNTMRTVTFKFSAPIIAAYDKKEVQKLQIFFAQTDSNNITNGTKVNTSYNSADPTTWTGVTWDNSNPKRVDSIYFNSKNLVGPLDISNFYKLTDLNFYNNQITSLGVIADTVLTSLNCSKNQLTSLDVSSNIALTELYCDNNQLKFSDMQGYYTTRSLDPQRPFIPIGVDTVNNHMSAIGGDTINLSAEAYVGTIGNKALTTFNVWKKAFDGTISEITDSCAIDSGKIVLPNTYSGNDSVFITMYNPSYSDFTTQTTPVIPTDNTMRTVTFKWLSSSAVLPTENNGKQRIKVYPNPANNYITITGNEDDLNHITIYNSLGQNVIKYTNYSAPNSKKIIIDISKLTAGIYIVKTKNTTNKLIIK